MESMVHLRSKKFKGTKGKVRMYYYLVKDIYENGKKKQKVIMYIGTANKLFEKLKQLEELSKKNS
jgi:hypothetical protein